jgi:hypothetical protein
MVEKFDTVNQGKAAGPPFKDGQEAFIIYLASASILLNQNRFLYFAPSALVARGLFKIIINWPRIALSSRLFTPSSRNTV